MTEPTLPHRGDAWERLGWVMASIWLVFLVFPLHAAITWPSTIPLRILAATLVLLFGVYYFVLWRFPRGDHPWLQLGMLTIVAASTYPLIGINTLGMVPFLVALSAFSFSPRTSYLAMAGLLGLTALLLWTTGQFPGWWFMVLPPAIVALMTGVIRFIDDRQRGFQELQDQYVTVLERERIARDLHDLLGQSLTAITLKAQVAQRLVSSQPEQAVGELKEIQALARRTIGEVRDTVGTLKARDLSDELAAAEQVLAAAGVELRRAGDPEQVLPRCRVPFAWALREAVTNVARHAHANTCIITLGTNRLQVDDDGVGRGAADYGNGLTGLAERLHGTGGTLNVFDRLGGGTRVEVTL